METIERTKPAVDTGAQRFQARDLLQQVVIGSLAVAPPGWLLNRSDGLRDNLDDLAVRWPLQALGVLAEVERWQRPVLEKAVAQARSKGSSWADIGAALGVSRQSAHERFRHISP